MIRHDVAMDNVEAPEHASLINEQRAQWSVTFAANPSMYGVEPSASGRYAAERFVADRLRRVLELGTGQGRDTMALLRAGLEVHALDYASEPLVELAAAVRSERDLQLTTVVHDVREALPFDEGDFDACYAHMLLTMALTTSELVALVAGVRRVLRPGALFIYTVRHRGDAHCGTGRSLGDGLFENGGFIVHFFDRPLVELLAEGFVLDDVTEFEEGDLPRKLWRVTMRRR